MGNNVINHDTTKENSFLVTISILATLIVLTIVIVLSFYYYRSNLSAVQNQKQDNADRHPYIESIENEAINSLNSLKWVDKKAGKLHIPIDIAKSNVIENYN